MWGPMRGPCISGVPNSSEKKNYPIPGWQFCSEEPLIEIETTD